MVRIGIVAVVVAVVVGCSSAPAVDTTPAGLTASEVADIIGPPICRQNATCEPDKFKSLYASQDACVSSGKAELVRGFGGGTTKCLRAFWVTCATDVDHATCDVVKAGTLPASCSCK